MSVQDARVEKLESELLRLANTVDDLIVQVENQCTSPVVIPIGTFAPEPFEFARPLNVVVSACENGFIASFIDANLSSSGETRFEAVENLKDLLIMAYQDFENEEEDCLGPAMVKQKKVIFDVMRRTP